MFTLDKNYGFHDPDLRPKPLRIAKRGHLRKSNSINTSRALSTSSTQRPLVPTRRSSILSTCTQSEVPQQDSLSKGSQWTVEDASCRLDNRFRRSSVDTATAVDTSSGTSGPSTSSKPGRRTYKYNIHNMVENHAEAGSNKIRSSVAARSTAVRAVTTGALNKANAPSATKDEGLPSVPTPLLLRRRAVTHGAPVSGEVETNRNSHGRGLRRQTSFGQGFVARMMSNLAHRSHNGPATTTYQDTSNHGPNEKAISLRAQSLEVREPLGRISESSGGTEGSNGSNLEDALAAFPTPPTSNGTSPRPSETFPAPPSELQRCRSLRKPESTSITGAELSLTAELDELSSDSDSDMLVAIDIEGPINPAASGQDLWSQHTGLDIVVIIDNS